ncbi:bifunctional (p)ppGpp synthetase/guanosine-3',5'-bis(diphosphate) 3'-pyrophosphohydrolase [Candidatus Kuenenbacteria bacterium]|nr:bifunctional (p)ppGpp synthetase/guanosine-3',5'-bis(diphosphate) 3'-pyrophosphohydrolase [Candidatus Kuenenbacteria bacterium]
MAEIDKIIKTILDKQPISSCELLKKTDRFLKSESKDLSFLDKKSISAMAYEKAQYAVNKNARIEFVCAALLFDLALKKKGLTKEIKKHLGEKIELLVRSHNFTKRKLQNENKRLFDHSYRTALILAGIKTDVPAICTALLHEVISHSDTNIEQIQKYFGKEIAMLLQNFQKVRSIKTANNQQYILHLREMVVAMAEDLRVIIIKMCSNIDRMKSPTNETPEKLKDIALESREIMAPLTDILGIWQLRWKLEDYSFKILDPEAYGKISRRFDIDERKNREKYIQKTKNILLNAAKEAGIKCQIEGRFKHFYSIHQKMEIKKKSFDEICDVFALRVIVNNIDDCYRLLGIIHRIWRPKQRRMKDYIAAPKSNHYRSLHTTVFGLNGRSTEFQIRTKQMNEEANYGIAAHWYYKNPRKKTPPWIQELLLKQQQYKEDHEFLSKFSSEILQNRIYTYTPKGDVISLPSGSTPIDFAYHIHTEIGSKCSGAVVNDITVGLDYVLSTNDVIKIIIDRTQSGPKSSWLNFVKTNAAKKHIENYFNKQPVVRSFRL